MKICQKHNCEKIYKNNRFKCQLCLNEYSKIYYAINKNKIQQKRDKNRDTIRSNSKKYRDKNKIKIKESNKQNYVKNKSKNSEYAKKRYVANKIDINNKANIYQKNRRKDDPVFKLRVYTSIVIASILKNNHSSKKGKSILKYLPYTIDELKQHLEMQFEPWMSWSNWGRYNAKTWNNDDVTTWTWQIDHIIPQSKFRHISMEDRNFSKCWALKNLRPYPSKYNILEGNRRSI